MCDRTESIDSRFLGQLAGILCLLVALTLPIPALATECSQEDITLSTQAEVDNFQSIYGGGGTCDTVTGTLYIGADITNLDGLSALTNVDGLTISDNGALTNLDGLSALTIVGSRSLTISNNASLTNLDGLSALTSVVGYLAIFQNATLTNVNGLSALMNVGELYVELNAALLNLDGLSGLTNVAGWVVISDNASLTNVNGLSGLIGVDGPLIISNNHSLTNLDGLSALTNAYRLTISDNAALTNLDGLSALTSLVWELVVSNNAVLTNVNGLSGLTRVNGLSISNNASLTNLDGLSVLAKVTDLFTISNNASLTNVNGLSALRSSFGLTISNNAALTNLDGLSALGSVGLSLTIKNNDALTDLDGLSALGSVTNYHLIIEDNAALANLDGLSRLISVRRDVSVGNNASLAACGGLKALLDVWDDGSSGPGPGSAGIPDVGGSVSIYANLPGCNSVDEILSEFNDCNTRDIALSSQAEVDSFQDTFGGGGICDTIRGDLTISGSDIIDLTPLADLTAINGGFTIENTPLENLNGLSGLSGSIRQIFIRQMNSLLDLDGLSGITDAEGIYLTDNPLLANVNGLSGLNSVKWSIQVSNNDLLTNLDGLSSISGEMGGSWGAGWRSVNIYIADNAALVNVDGLSGITGTTEHLTVSYNPSLESLDGLSKITGVTGGIEIYGNALLVNCDGLKVLLDDVDDAEPGPGPGSSGIPDVGGDVGLGGNLGCNSVGDIFSGLSALSVTANATDGTYAGHVAITWQADIEGAHFDVSRCWDESPSHCQSIATTDVGATKHLDAFADAGGQVHYYRLRACNDIGCSPYGPPDAGHRLGYPKSLTATDGDFLDKVRLTWVDTDGESYYEVYICFTASENSCGSPIDVVAANDQSYDDTLASSDGTVFYYRLKACNENGCSTFSNTDAGNRLSNPQSVSATDGFFEDRVRIIWTDVIGETSYQVYRCASPDKQTCGSAIASTGANVTLYEDFGASASGTIHFYRLKSCNPNGCTEFSVYDEGNRAVPDLIFWDGFEGQ